MTHNNIQLSSVLMDENQNIKLSKFGFGFETVIDLLNENEDYFAPEVYENEQFTHQSDVYAFGVLMLKLMGIDVSVKFSQCQRILTIWMV
jgi:serine/threonine protein kinase